jgi:5-methylcytosine-specific restriction endonuclease McrA
MRVRKGLKERGMRLAWWKKTTQNHMKRVTHGLPRLTLREWMERLDEFDYCCAYCGEELEGMGWIEHLTPVGDGGEHRKHNVVPACQPCNQRKGKKSLAEFTKEHFGVALSTQE